MTISTWADRTLWALDLETTSADPEQPFFTIKQLAAYLNVSERTVRDMLARHRIASYRVEGQRRIAVEDVDAYLRRQRDERR
jgi:excisionase family DNA binding protein